MSLTSIEQSIEESYSTKASLKYESERLFVSSPVEGRIVARKLNKHIKDGERVLEVGVGVGVYSELLTRRGCNLSLVDVTQALLGTNKGGQLGLICRCFYGEITRSKT